jgi:MFS family permease
MSSVTWPRVGRGWYYGWNVVAIGVLSQVAANGLTYNSFSLFLHGWSTEMHAPISRLQLSIAAMVLPSALLSPFVGSLADKYPARALCACGLLGMACFYFAISMTTAGWQIVALYGLLAPLPLVLATAVTVNTVVSRWFVHRRGLALGLSSFGVGMAGIVLPPLIAAALPAFGWRMIWRVGGLVLALLVMPLVVAVMRHQPTKREGLHYLSIDGRSQPHHDEASKGAQPTLGEILSRKNFWLVIASYVPLMALYGGFGQNLAPYAVNHGLSQLFAGTLISVFSLSHLLATFVTGPLSDRFGNRLPFAGLSIITASGAVVAAFATSAPAIIFASALIGLAGGLQTLQAAAIAAEFGTSAFGRAYGLSLLFIPVASLTPYCIAKVQESTGSYVPALLAVAVIVMVGGAISLLLDERPGGRLANVEKTTLKIG